MENASKALLVAASVLIAIVLIAVGMRIFDSTDGTVDSIKITTNATEISAFNNKFMPYMGANKTKENVMSLVNVVISHNSSVSSDKQVHLKVSQGTNIPVDKPIEQISYFNYDTFSLSQITDQYIYNIRPGIGVNGLINEIYIDRKK